MVGHEPDDRLERVRLTELGQTQRTTDRRQDQSGVADGASSATVAAPSKSAASSAASASASRVLPTPPGPVSVTSRVRLEPHQLEYLVKLGLPTQHRRRRDGDTSRDGPRDRGRPLGRRNQPRPAVGVEPQCVGQGTDGMRVRPPPFTALQGPDRLDRQPGARGQFLLGERGRLAELAQANSEAAVRAHPVSLAGPSSPSPFRIGARLPYGQFRSGAYDSRPGRPAPVLGNSMSRFPASLTTFRRGVVLLGWGHVAIDKSACALAVTAAYLTDPIQPLDRTCPTNVVPFSPVAAQKSTAVQRSLAPAPVLGR